MAGKATKPAAKAKAKSSAKPKAKVTVRPAAKAKAKSSAKPKAEVTVRPTARAKAKSLPKPKTKVPVQLATKTKSSPPVKSKPNVTRKATPKTAAKSSVKPKKKTRGASRFDGIKKALIVQRETLLSEAGTVINSTVRVGSSPDLTDQASAESDQAFVLKLKEREQKLLSKIDETLERIDQGNYGICLSCEALIPLPRLRVRPVTTLCIECKTLEEEEENLRRG